MGLNAQTSVPSFTAGAVLTATQQNQSARTGVPVFATTTTRDAAFGGAGQKTLAQGQLCYIEASNIVQYYNGSTWQTLGPGAAAYSNLARVETLQSTSSTSYTDLATVGPSVTLTTGTSVMVLHGMQGYDDGNLGNNAIQSVAVSGATTTAAADTWYVYADQGINYAQFATGYLFTVTAGSNTFTCKYKKSGGTSTASFERRWIMAIAL